MEWENAAGYYEKRLSQALDIQRYALRLSKMSQVGIPENLKKDLEEVEKPAKIQLKRLKRREFRIAVVGLEKAGKSTFVNAWLEKDLLPHDNPRCTYTTTEIHSVADNGKQRLEVKSKTEDAFSKMIKELEEKSQGNDDNAKNAKNDLKTINENIETLQHIIDKGDEIFNFERLDGIEENLKKYVADPAYAHAVKEVRLHTSRIAPLDGVVFFDVPGLDSGLGKHLDDSEKMLRDCDAVICIQKSNNPSLRAGEQKLIEYVKAGDTDVELEDKLFVFLSRIDKEGTPASLKTDIEKAKEEWKRYGLDNHERIVAGSAAAYLFIKGVAGEVLKRNVGNSSVNDLMRVTECTEDESEKMSGIPVIKEKIETYLKTERFRVLEKRCERLIKRIKEPARKIFEDVAARYPDDPDEAIKNEETRRIERLLRWWDEEKWNELKAELGRYQDRLLGDSSEPEANEQIIFMNFNKRYTDSIKEGMKHLPSRIEKRRDNLFDSLKIKGRGEDWVYANYEWRSELYSDVMNCIENVAMQLSGEILEETDNLIAKMAELLWEVDVKRIRNKIIDSRKELHDRLYHGLRTLFLRFSRPVAKALIVAPQGSDQRKAVVKELGADMDMLDPYYEGKELAYECLRKFVNHGEALLSDPKLRKNILGTSDILVSKTVFSTSEPGATRENMIREIETDLNALEEYLVNAIFSAAGFGAYRKQEINRLCEKFNKVGSIWIELLKEEYYSNNKILLSEIPQECLQKAYDTEVCDRLKQLRIAFNKFGTVGI